MASGEEAELLVPSFARFRATYQGEGYYDDREHGDPLEQDLFAVEIFDATSEPPEGWEPEEWAEEHYEDLCLRSASYHILLPAAHFGEEEEERDQLRHREGADAFNVNLPVRRHQLGDDLTAGAARHPVFRLRQACGVGADDRERGRPRRACRHRREERHTLRADREPVTCVLHVT